MSVAQSETHKENLSKDKYTKNQKIVLKAIKQGYGTIQQIVFVSGLPEKTVSGRISELTDVGKIKPTKQSGSFSFYKEVTNMEEIKQLISERLEEKRRRWINRGKRLGFIA